MKTSLLFIIYLGCLLNLQPKTDSNDPKSAIGKTVKNISEIPFFKDYREGGVLIKESKENKNSFIEVTNGVRTFALYTKFSPPQSEKILAILDVGKIEKDMRLILTECRV